MDVAHIGITATYAHGDGKWDGRCSQILANSMKNCFQHGKQGLRAGGLFGKDKDHGIALPVIFGRRETMKHVLNGRLRYGVRRSFQFFVGLGIQTPIVIFLNVVNIYNHH
ncbi:hypothetical protein SDC9_100263 [bioreactor metagenome]|uniref:Uncharacterized protein n=1 Tax=bioreactor metagenome TaxID=1076179 RepID=A0A645AJV9_9ZZZZ